MAETVLGPLAVDQHPAFTHSTVDPLAALSTMRQDLRLRAGRGLAFIMAGLAFWTGLGVVGLAGLSAQPAALVYLWATGAIFPLGWLLGRIMGHEVLTRENPLAMLAAYLSGLQVLYFPVLLWACMYQPAVVPWFLGALTGAHFLPFGWLYGSRAYIVGAGLGVFMASATVPYVDICTDTVRDGRSLRRDSAADCR
jgi:hypothetical protein